MADAKPQPERLTLDPRDLLGFGGLFLVALGVGLLVGSTVNPLAGIGSGIALFGTLPLALGLLARTAPTGAGG